MEVTANTSIAKFRGMLACACLLLVCAGEATAASAGSGQAYGLNVNATLFPLGSVNVGPLATTGPQTAPADFDVTQTTASANVNAAVLNVTTGVLTGDTQSLLAQNAVQTFAQVDGLSVTALTLALGATTVRSNAATACVAGFPTATGSTLIVGGTGLLAGITAPAPNTQLTVLDAGTPIATVFLNEQIVSGASIIVNAIRIELNVLGVVTASVIIDQSRAAITNCQPTVTIDTAPVINVANQGSYTVAGTCSAGSGNVVVTLPGAVASPQSVPCSAGGTWSATFNATPVAQGTVTITATQTDGAGLFDTATRNTTKDTIAPLVTVDTAPVINAANQNSYSGVSGTCSELGQPVTVSIGSVGVTPSPICAGGTWTAPAANVSSVPDGTVTITASQTDAAGNFGSGTRNVLKDVVAPVVTVSTAPPSTPATRATMAALPVPAARTACPLP